MTTEYIRYRIAAGRAMEFLASYEEAAESLRASPHCQGYDLTRCAEDPERFVLRILWDSAAGHIEVFRKGPHFPPFFRAVQPYLNDIEEMRHYELTPLRWSR